MHCAVVFKFVISKQVLLVLVCIIDILDLVCIIDILVLVCIINILVLVCIIKQEFC